VSEESKKKMLLLRISVGEPWGCSAAAEESSAAAAVAGSRGELEKTARLLAYVLVGVIG